MVHLNIFVCCLWPVDIHLLAPFVEKAILPALDYLCTLPKNQLDIFGWVYFWVPCSIPLTHVSVFSPVPHGLDYCTSVLYSKP